MVRLSILPAAFRFALLSSLALVSVYPAHGTPTAQTDESGLSTERAPQSEPHESFCEDWVERKRNPDVPLHFLTFHLYERDGWSMKRCVEAWTDLWDEAADWLRVPFISYYWATRVWNPVPILAKGKCVVQAQGQSVNLIRRALKCLNPLLKVPECIETSEEPAAHAYVEMRNF